MVLERITVFRPADWFHYLSQPEPVAAMLSDAPAQHSDLFNGPDRLFFFAWQAWFAADQRAGIAYTLGDAPSRASDKEALDRRLSELAEGGKIKIIWPYTVLDVEYPKSSQMVDMLRQVAGNGEGSLAQTGLFQNRAVINLHAGAYEMLLKHNLARLASPEYRDVLFLPPSSGTPTGLRIR